MAYRGGRGRSWDGRGASGWSSGGASRRGGSGFQTRTNASGYKQYRNGGGAWKFTHIRVAEKKVGGPIGPGRQVHHINGDKRDNRPGNLMVLPAGLHRWLHRKGK
jgi:hypothetical protein